MDEGASAKTETPSFCAEGGTRTRMGQPPHASETCVSTSFTTSALKLGWQKYKRLETFQV